MPSRVEFRPGRVRAFATGVARRDVRKTTAEINRLARRKAPGGPYSTGRLKASINWSLAVAGYHVRGRSGSDLDYAIFVHEGVDRHPIVPVRKPMLVFFWRRAGRVVHLLRVNHPGQASQPFLVEALLSVAPRRGYMVKIYR